MTGIPEVAGMITNAGPDSGEGRMSKKAAAMVAKKKVMPKATQKEVTVEDSAISVKPVKGKRKRTKATGGSIGG